MSPKAANCCIIPCCSMNLMQKLKKDTEREREKPNSTHGDEDINQNEELLCPIEELVLADLPNMECLWRQEPKIPVFKSLKYLEFARCHSLKTLFSISIVKNLEKLELLKLYNCEEMEHVLNGQVDHGRTVEFKSLKQLILKCLPKLESFYKGEENYEFEWPKLEIVRVKLIPKMDTFAKGTHKTPKLKEFCITHVSNYWQKDLNVTIEYLKDRDLLGEEVQNMISRCKIKGPDREDPSAEAVANGKKTRAEDSTAVVDSSCPKL